MTTDNPTQLGMIGLGRMGANLVRRLIRDGHECVGATRSSTAATPTTATTSGAPNEARSRHHYVDVRHQRRRLRPRARLLPDDRRGGPRSSSGSSRSSPRSRRASARRPRTPGRTGEPSRPSRATCTAARTAPGHFVKMVHNGIEYGMMAAYAEGLNILRHADAGKTRRSPTPRPAPLTSPSSTSSTSTCRGRRGLAARQRGRLLAARPDRRGAGRVPQLAEFSGRVSDSGEGRWTSIAAIDEGVPTPVLTTALYDRFSRAASATSPTRSCPRCARASAATTRALRGQRQGSNVLSSRLMSKRTPLKSFALSAGQNFEVASEYSAWNTGLPAATYWSYP
jgi:6-phosphogluconate dehydrogenase